MAAETVELARRVLELLGVKFRDGKVLRFQAFREPERALERLGQ
jgi:hypothetical protein